MIVKIMRIIVLGNCIRQLYILSARLPLHADEQAFFINTNQSFLHLLHLTPRPRPCRGNPEIHRSVDTFGPGDWPGMFSGRACQGGLDRGGPASDAMHEILEKKGILIT